MESPIIEVVDSLGGKIWTLQNGVPSARMGRESFDTITQLDCIEVGVVSRLIGSVRGVPIGSFAFSYFWKVTISWSVRGGVRAMGPKSEVTRVGGMFRLRSWTRIRSICRLKLRAVVKSNGPMPPA